MQPDMIGGRYRVDSAIGRGGMGTVWLCHDEILHRVVAVKQVGLLPGESVTDSARAFREARSSAGLSHRNVVTIFDVVEESSHIWLVMEHVPGRSLSEIIKQDGPLDPAVAADIGAQVAEGLAALHAAGIMHRDVKPGNVLIREDGIAKVSDFGIARTTGDATLTQSGYVTGTPSYFSPALARGIEPGPVDDVWALGATLYAAVEGRSPYESRANPVVVLHEITSAQPPAPQHADFLEPALQRLMDRDPGSRWSMDDAAYMLRQLAQTHRLDVTQESTRAVLPQEPVAVPPPPPAPSPGTAPATGHGALPESEPVAAPKPTRRGGRPRLVVATLVGALVVLLGAVVLSHLGNGADPGKTAGGKHAQSTSKSTKSPATSSDAGSATKDRVSFVRDYYSKASGATDAAWKMLGPGEQRQGRASYNGFWRTIASVRVASARALTGTDEVDVTLVYRSTDGKVSTEHKRERLSTTDSGYLIESDVPVS